MKRPHLSDKQSIPTAEIKAQKSKILKSGLFKLDENGAPAEMYGLTPGKKEISKSRTIEGIPALNVKILSTKLSNVVGYYVAGIPFPQYLRPEYQPDGVAAAEKFEESFLNFINPRFFDKEKLKPQLTEFLKKAKKLTEKEFKLTWGKDYKPQSGKGKLYDNLAIPLYVMFQKYLTDQRSRAPYIPKTDIFHYIAHLLAICGLENKPHKTVFERIKQYIYRR